MSKVLPSEENPDDAMTWYKDSLAEKKSRFGCVALDVVSLSEQPCEKLLHTARSASLAANT